MDPQKKTYWFRGELERRRRARGDAVGTGVAQAARDQGTESAVGLDRNSCQAANPERRVYGPQPVADGAVLRVGGVADRREHMLRLVVRLRTPWRADLIVLGPVRQLPQRNEQDDGCDSTRRAAKPGQAHERSD